MPSLRYGTCSWSEKSWVGPFYPAGTKSADYLRHYATAFDTVEVDSSYYGIPPTERVQRWVADTPPGFIFSSKMPRDCTLGGDAREADPANVLNAPLFEAPLARHLASMNLLGDKRGPTVIQCPWFSPGMFSSLGAFLARVDTYLAAASGLAPLVLEVRNREFLHADTLAVLKARGAALVLSEVRGMPHPADVAEKLDVLTTDWWYARLIGDRTKVDRLTKTFDRVVIDQTPSLGRWAHLVRTLASSADGFVYANNHFAGHGPETIRELRALVEANCPPPAP